MPFMIITKLFLLNSFLSGNRLSKFISHWIHRNTYYFIFWNSPFHFQSNNWFSCIQMFLILKCSSVTFLLFTGPGNGAVPADGRLTARAWANRCRRHVPPVLRARPSHSSRASRRAAHAAWCLRLWPFDRLDPGQRKWLRRRALRWSLWR